VHTDFIGERFTTLLDEVKTLTGSETGIKQVLQKADEEAKAYAKKHIKQKPESDKAKAGRTAKAG
jgi:CRISPR-associated protein Csc2